MYKLITTGSCNNVGYMNQTPSVYFRKLWCTVYFQNQNSRKHRITERWEGQYQLFRSKLKASYQCLFLIATIAFIAVFEFNKDNKCTFFLWFIHGFLWKSWLHIRPTKSRVFQRTRAIGRQYFLGDQSKIIFRSCSSPIRFN